MPVRIVIAIHNHQPVGNFDSVFAEVTARCYRPFLDTLARHPGVRLSMHWSGPLLEWLEAHDAALLDRLGELVSRDQVELLMGPFYEPILPVIPPWDQEDQIARTRGYLRRRFGVEAEGAWIPERVWEPDLPDLLARCGVRYTLLDDHHFLLAGLTPRDLREIYRIESTLGGVDVFPIERELRYQIPFAPFQDFLRYLESSAADAGEIRVFGDDGEKFGVWPNTYEWVYPEGWLERWFAEMEAGRRIVSMPLRDAWRERPAVRRAALPAASYPEMMLWSLPPEAQEEVEEAERALTDQGHDAWARRMAGGSWRAFLARYSESRRANRRVTTVSARIEGLGRAGEAGALADEARREIQRAQCNCAYWHGIFGGIYLPHLRQAVREHTIRAEALADRAEGAPGGWSLESGEAEVRLRSGSVALTLDLEQDGDLVEIAWRPRPFDFASVMTRRFEAYHARLARAATDGAPAGTQPSTIHGAIQLKEADLAEHLEYDVRPRSASQEWLLPDASDLRAGALRERTRAIGRPVRYRLESAASEGVAGRGVPGVALAGWLDGAGGVSEVPVVRKRVEAGSRPEAFRLLLETSLQKESWLVSEWNLTLLTPDAPGRRLIFSGAEPGTHAPGTSGASRAVRSVRLEDDEYLGLAIVLDLAPAAAVNWAPVETVSLSEAGAERLYQGTSLLLAWPVGRSPSRCSIEVRLEETGRAA
jgi:hypothetical protein